MPNYDYECDSCDNVFEEFHKIADREIPVGKTCGKCGEGLIRMKLVFPGVADPVRLGLRKPDATFREHLKEIKRKHRSSKLGNINTF